MLAAILSDIHGNFDALQATLADVDSQAPDVIYCLGDLVGYGAEPVECLAAVRDRGIACVAGNHDFAVADTTSTEFFNSDAKRSIVWTRSMLGSDAVTYLRDLPLTLTDNGITLFHGALANPEAFDYVLTTSEAQASFGLLSTTLGFFGHTHVPYAFLQTDGTVGQYAADFDSIPEGTRALINVGSVGQPRDENPCASYLLYDSTKQRTQLRRVEYRIDLAAQKILAAGLPEMNAYRLIMGR